MSIFTPTYHTPALLAAKAGAEAIIHYWGKLEGYKQKSSLSDLVTVADQESEDAVLAILKKYFPDHSYLAEESGLNEMASEYLWIIDPLDGTTNFTHQYPVVAVSIALFHQGSPLLGIVYNPITNELYEAEKGKGAFLNGNKIGVSSVNELSKSLLATGFAYDRLKTPETNYREFTHFTNLTQGVRRAGSAALDLAYVASGRLDGYWERGIQAWDMAAGMLLVTEAGGTISSYDGSEVDIYSGRILASNGRIHKQISEQLTIVKESRG